MSQISYMQQNVALLLKTELNFAQIFIKKKRLSWMNLIQSNKLFKRGLRPSLRSEMLALLWRIVWKLHKN